MSLALIEAVAATSNPFSTGTAALGFTGTIPAGSLVVALFGTGADRSVTSVTDDGGNTYTLGNDGTRSATQLSGGAGIEVWCYTAVTTATMQTVTAVLNTTVGTVSTIALFALSSPHLTSAVLEVRLSTQASSTSHATGPVTSAGVGHFIVGIIGGTNGVYNNDAGGGFTSLLSITNFHVGYRTVDAATTTWTPTTNAAETTNSMMLLFQPAADSGSPAASGGGLSELPAVQAGARTRGGRTARLTTAPGIPLVLVAGQTPGETHFDRPAPRPHGSRTDKANYQLWYMVDDNLPFFGRVDQVPPGRPRPHPTITETGALRFPTPPVPAVGMSIDQATQATRHARQAGIPNGSMTGDRGVLRFSVAAPSPVLGTAGMAGPSASPASASRRRLPAALGTLGSEFLLLQAVAPPSPVAGEAGGQDLPPTRRRRLPDGTIGSEFLLQLTASSTLPPGQVWCTLPAGADVRQVVRAMLEGSAAAPPYFYIPAVYYAGPAWQFLTMPRTWEFGTMLNQDVSPKQPEEIAAYTGDWRRRLADAAAGVTILQSAWSIVDGDGLLGVAGHAIHADGDRTSVTLTAGTAGQVYTLRNQVTLSDGQVWRDYGVVEIASEGALLRI